jgi:hypothetical protein
VGRKQGLSLASLYFIAIGSAGLSTGCSSNDGKFNKIVGIGVIKQVVIQQPVGISAGGIPVVKNVDITNKKIIEIFMKPFRDSHVVHVVGMENAEFDIELSYHDGTKGRIVIVQGEKPNCFWLYHKGRALEFQSSEDLNDWVVREGKW